MRRCPHCGKVVAFKAVHCPACGGKLEQTARLQDTRPFLPSFDAAPEVVSDTERLPALDMEIQEPLDDPFPDHLRQTVVDEPDEDLRATVVNSPPGTDLDQTLLETPAAHDDDLRDTLVRDPPEPQELPPITFSAAGDALRPMTTGARPLDADDFQRTHDAARQAASQPPPASPPTTEAVDRSPSSGMLRLARILALVASVAWVALASIMVTGFLNVRAVTALLAALPLPPEALTSVPALLVLATLLAAAATERRLLGAEQARGQASIFLRLLFWVSLAALPGIGLLLGMGGSIYLIGRGNVRGPADRLVGWMLIFFTLAWQDIAAVILLTHFRGYLP